MYKLMQVTTKGAAVVRESDDLNALRADMQARNDKGANGLYIQYPAQSLTISADHRVECEEIADLLLEGNRPMAVENFCALVQGLPRTYADALGREVDAILTRKTSDAYTDLVA